MMAELYRRRKSESRMLWPKSGEVDEMTTSHNCRPRRGIGLGGGAGGVSTPSNESSEPAVMAAVADSRVS